MQLGLVLNQAIETAESVGATLTQVARMEVRFRRKQELLIVGNLGVGDVVPVVASHAPFLVGLEVSLFGEGAVTARLIANEGPFPGLPD